jgi:hypothetical protein
MFLSRLCLAGLVCALLSPAATITVTPTVTGSYQYSYLVSPIAPGETLFLFRLSSLTSLGTVSGSITAPTGWDIIELLNEITFTSTDPGFDIASGASGTFAFNSILPPASIGYEGTFADGIGDVTAVLTGNVTGPSEVPEPAVGGSLILVAAWIWRRHRVSRS